MEQGLAVFSSGEPVPLHRIWRWLWGTGLIEALQKAGGPALDAFMKQFTRLGSFEFYAAVLLFLFWCVNERKAFRLAVLVMLSGWINGVCKAVFRLPRPHEIDGSLGLAREESFGFPSGHAQLSVVFWPVLALEWRKRAGKPAAWSAALLLPLGIAFSRLYLGVHFPADILGGWILGAAALGVFLLFGERTAVFLRGLDIRFRLFSAAVLAFFLNAGAGEDFGGLFLGFCAGYAVNTDFIRFSAAAHYRGEKPRLREILPRFFLGMAGILLLRFLLRALLPGEESLFRELPFWGAGSPLIRAGRFLRSGVPGFFAAAGAPWLFLKLGLAARHPVPERET